MKLTKKVYIWRSFFIGVGFCALFAIVAPLVCWILGSFIFMDFLSMGNSFWFIARMIFLLALFVFTLFWIDEGYDNTIRSWNSKYGDDSLEKLKEDGKIKRVGPDKGGRWEVLK